MCGKQNPLTTLFLLLVVNGGEQPTPILLSNYLVEGEEKSDPFPAMDPRYGNPILYIGRPAPALDPRIASGMSNNGRSTTGLDPRIVGGGELVRTGITEWTGIF